MCTFASLSSTACTLPSFFNDPATTEIYTLSLHDALPIWIDAPEFPGVGKVKLAADGSAETTLQHGGKGFGSGSGSRQELAGCVGKDAQGKGLGEPKEQVQRLQGKVDPTALQKDSAMAGLIQQVLPQQAMQIAHDLSRGDGVKAVAPEVAMDAIELEAPGIPSDAVSQFEDRDAGNLLLDKLVCRAGAGGAGAENHDVVLGRRRMLGNRGIGHLLGIVFSFAGSGLTPPGRVRAEEKRPMRNATIPPSRPPVITIASKVSPTDRKSTR